MKQFFSTVSSLIRKNALFLTVVGLGAGTAIALENEMRTVSQELGEPIALEVIPGNNEEIAPASIEGDGIWIMADGTQEIMPANADDLFIELKNKRGAVLASWNYEDVRENGVWVDANGDACEAGEGTCVGYKIGTDYALNNGYYTFEIPEGFFHITTGEGENVVYHPNAAVELSWTLYDPDTTIELSVEPQATDESDPENASIAPVALEKTMIFALVDDKEAEVTLNHVDDLFITLTNEKGIELASFDHNELLDLGVIDGDVCLGYELNLAEYITAAGYYTMTIPAGFFDVNVGMDGVFAPNAEKEVKWLVIDPNATAEINVLPEATDESDPENASIAPVALEEVQIFAGEGINEEIIPANNDLFITLTNAKGIELASWNATEVIEGAVANENDITIGYTINVAEYITGAGYYTLTIPEGFFEVAQAGMEGLFTPNAEKVVKWFVVPAEIELSVSPEATDESDMENASIAPVALEETMIYALVGGQEAEVTLNHVDDLFITLTNAKGITLASFDHNELLDLAVVDGDVCLGYSLNLAEYVTAAGYYTLTIPAGFFDVNVGVDGVFAPNAEKEVKWLVIDPNATAEINVLPEATNESDAENASIAPVALEEVQIFAGEGINEEIITANNDLFITLTNAKGIELASWNATEVIEGAIANENDITIGYTLNVAQYITGAGYYTLNIPEGFFEVATAVEGLFAPNAAKEVKWLVIPASIELSVLPGATDESSADNASIAPVALEKTMIYALVGGQEAEVILNHVDGLFITLTNEKGITLASFDHNELLDLAVIDGDICLGYELNLAEYVTAAGYYTLTIPAGFFDVNVGMGNVFAPNAEMEVKWLVIDPNATAEINVLPEATDESDPENASIAPVALEEVQIFAGEGINEEIIPANNDLFITLTNAKGIELASWNATEVIEGAVANENDITIGYTINVAEYITGAGYYTLTIPEGFFEVAQAGMEGLFTPNAEKVVKWFVVPAEIELSVLPDATDESEIDNASIAPVALEETMIYALVGGQEAEVTLNHVDDLYITLTNAKGITLASFDHNELLDLAVMDDDVCLGYSLNLAEYVTAAGYYTLTIPAGFFDVNVGVDGVFAPNAEKEVKWLVIDPNATAEINVLPEATDESDAENASIAPVALEEVQIFAGEGINEEILTANNDLFITLTNAKGIELASWNANEVIEGAIANENDITIGYTINVAEHITGAGYYTLNIPEGFFEVATAVEGLFAPNAAKEVKWLVIEPEASIYVSPEDGEQISNVALEQFYVAADYNAMGEIILSHNDELFITLANAKGVELARWSQDEVMEYAIYDEVACRGFKWDMAEYITAEGTYTVTIPAGFFEVAVEGLDGVFVPNAETIASYDVIEIDPSTGIDFIFNGVDTTNGFNVNTINGMNILRNGNIEDLNNLENGIYIINGKKVMIRK